MLTDLLQIGNKIDICALNKSERRNSEDQKVPIWSSQLVDVNNNGNMVIDMPMYKGKIILLSVGTRYEMIFYTRNGLYRGVGQVTDRYKDGKFFMVRMELKTKLTKFQRREYFRLQCILSVDGWELSRDEALTISNDELAKRITDPEIVATMANGIIVDISGGGIRFISERRHEEDDCMIIRTQLQNESLDQELLVLVSVVSCRKASPNMERYETRAEFMHLGKSLRETIIKYIFDEDRKIRKKDVGV
jgi:c-di-GMP-binding flagellar brake protein YcgR